MVSALWNACTEGDLNAVIGLLDNAAPGDIEVKGVLKSLLVRAYNVLLHKSLTLTKITMVLHPSSKPSRMAT